MRNGNNTYSRVMDIWMNFPNISLSRLSFLIIDVDRTFWIISWWIMTCIEYYTSPWVKAPSFSEAGLPLWYSLWFLNDFNFFKEKKSTINTVGYGVPFPLNFCGYFFSSPTTWGESKGRERPWEIWLWVSGICLATSLANARFFQDSFSLSRGMYHFN